MPYMTGLEFLSSIDNFQKVIIVSAYEQYALKGYEFNVVESMENYVIIHTSNSKEIVNITLKKMMDKLPEDIFLQVHRCYIGNLDHVVAIDGNILKVNSHQIPISRNLREMVIDRFV